MSVSMWVVSVMVHRWMGQLIMEHLLMDWLMDIMMVGVMVTMVEKLIVMTVIIVDDWVLLMMINMMRHLDVHWKAVSWSVLVGMRRGLRVVGHILMVGWRVIAMMAVMGLWSVVMLYCVHLVVISLFR